jgi:hypothetical protein
MLVVMRKRRPGRWIAGAAGLLAAALAPAGRAHADAFGDAVAVVGGVLAPADVGVTVPRPDLGTAGPVIAWSVQIPLAFQASGPSLSWPASPHRIVPEIELLPHVGAVSWRGRLGYRYAGRTLIAGAGASVDGPNMSLSPELGLKFAHAFNGRFADDIGIDLSMHLLARAEIAPESGHLRGVTFMLGWNLF